MSTNRRNPFAVLAQIYSGPFRPSSLTHGAREGSSPHARRQRDILRFLTFNVALIQGIRFLVTTANPPPVDVTITEFAAIALSLLCLVLTYRQKNALASILFVYGALALAAWTSLIGPGSLSLRSLLTFALLPLLIVLSGLILPERAIWPTAGMIILGLIAGLIFFPVDPALQATVTPQNIKALTGGIFGFLFLGTTLVTVYMAHTSTIDYATVRDAFQREQELAALKDHFIVDANHELRTPIMSLFNNVELLQKVHARVGDDQRGALIARALKAGEMVLRMLNTILDSDVVSARTPDVKPAVVELAPVVRALVGTFDPTVVGEPGLEGTLFTPRDVTVAIAPDVRVWADEDRLRQIFTNLLTNALKYSDSGTPINIMAARRHEATRGGALVEITVRDHGMGVPPEEIPKLFQRFVRLNRDIAGPVRGTGVGLYLCRVLVEAMGGRIWVESSGIPGEGSTFHFTLPETAPASAGELPTPPRAKSPVAPSLANRRSRSPCRISPGRWWICVTIRGEKSC